MINRQFERVSSGMLLNGMYLDSDLFYLVEGKPVLLCHGTVIDASVLERLRDISKQNVEIYIEEGSYQRLLRQHEYVARINHYIAKSYDLARQKMTDFLRDTAYQNRVNQEAIVRLVSLTQNTLDIMKPYFLLQLGTYMSDMDDLLQTHSVDVAILNGVIGRWLGLSEDKIEKLLTIGLLHDIGKLRIPERILNKPGRLTKEEFDVVKRHPVYSYDMLKTSGFQDEEVLQGVKYHHERISGGGYPEGLVLDHIPKMAKITAISDIYDAMISKRVYKESATPLKVLDSFYRDQFSDLDPRIVNLFLEQMIRELQGKVVILSTGEVGTISYIEKTRIEYPMVEIDGKVEQTDGNRYVVSVCGEIV